MNFEAALFDLDGTLIDSISVWRRVDEAFLAKRGIEVPDDYMKAISSMNFYQAAEYSINRFGFQEATEDIVQEWREMVYHEYANNIPLKESVEEYLSYLKQKGIKIGLCTASPEDLYEAVLKNNGIYHLFDAFSSTEEVARGKGFPDVYLHTAKKLGIEPEKCVVFEDILPGIKGAKAANMLAVGVYDKESETDKDKIESLADYYLYQFSELME
ncbi:HAD family phosphatase [Paludicola sp. MB14-C6]|uniref:HAD family hydrolase n=1 Tax=Paludihabitans sp. MB14-C6 TaxID=3070656 RepID=UPI0027DB4262|nr:HAD family phosphatase [Paludicola sp. MB14-C6]WMJ21930.1 HAD family phosphatase [Paludicola sp. MB14-C6]